MAGGARGSSGAPNPTGSSGKVEAWRGLGGFLRRFGAPSEPPGWPIPGMLIAALPERGPVRLPPPRDRAMGVAHHPG